MMATTAVVPSGTVLMSADEARACINRIREGMENVLELVGQLHDQEGWRALGYESWSACVDAELSISRSRAYQLLDLAQINRALSTVVDTGPIPEAHARELAPVKKDPEVVREIYSQVIDETGGKPTQAATRAGVDKHLGRLPKTKPAADRKSVTSKAETSDFADDAPDYANESQDTYPSTASKQQRCTRCTDFYDGDDCPCPVQSGSSQESGGTVQASGQPEASDTSTTEGEPSESRSSSQPSGRTSGGTGLGSKPIPAPAAHRPIAVDGKAPVQVYPTPTGLLDGVESHLSGDQLDDFAQRFGAYYRGIQTQRRLRGAPGETPELDTRPDLRAVLAGGWTVSELAAAIKETRTVPERQALQALLLAGQPIEEVRGVFRLADTMIRRHNDTVQRDAIVAEVR